MRSGARIKVAIGAALAALALPSASEAAAPEPDDGWAQRALGIQYEVASDVGWTNMPWVGTHNSYNSIEQTGVALSPNDSNQQITNVAQLEAGVRSLELDVHRFPDLPGTSGPLRVCHARPASEGHLGCTTEKELAPTLAEIVEWLDRPANSDEVLLLYLEDHMGDAAGYNGAADVVNAELGHRLYKPPPGGCSEVPSTLTREQIQAAGKQAFIVSDCGPAGASGWHGVAFNWDSHVESRPFDYEDFPDCGPDFTITKYETAFVRYFEDSTQLTERAGTPDDGITPATAAAMARCGVDLVGLDQVTGPEDPRFEGLVWSWQVNRPRPGMKGERNCAVQRRNVEVAPELAFGGSAEPATRAAWFDHRCARLHAAACRDAAGAWTIESRRVTQRKARKACKADGLVLGTPRTGYEAQGFDAALEAAGVRQAWIGAKRKPEGWATPDPPPAP